MRLSAQILWIAIFSLLSKQGHTQGIPGQRARDLGIPFDGIPGKWNAITDVPGVEVGYKTLISGSGKLVVGKGPIRTGVTVILPKGKTNGSYPAAWFSLNGDGEMTGLPYIEDFGVGYGPVELPIPIVLESSGMPSGNGAINIIQIVNWWISHSDFRLSQRLGMGY